MPVGSSWNGLRNRASGSTTSNPASPSKTPISNATPTQFVANGSANTFETIEEAQDQATQWLWTYNNERPNTGIGGITPAMKLKTTA